MKELGIASAILCLVFGLLVSVWFDSMFPVSWTPTFYLFASVPLLVALLARRERAVQVAMCAYVAVLVALPFLVLSPVKPFTLFFTNVHEGMVEAEVITELIEQFPDASRFPRPVHGRSDDGDLWFQLDPNDGAYNVEFIMIQMKNGQVVSKEYLPD